jgi:hypothetical protein
MKLSTTNNQTITIMEIIAKTEGEGFLIKATRSELVEILRSVTGEEKKEINIGQKIPAIDYASTITKLKTLNQEWNYKELLKRSKDVSETINDLEEAVNNASKI